MIGNDIVDLNRAALESDPLRPRFLKKVFTGRELAVILWSSNPLKLAWLFWTMKEAAYKAHQRRFLLPRIFNPLLQEGWILKQSPNAAWGVVRIGEMVYYITSELNANYIHSVASIHSRDNRSTSYVYPSSVDLKQKLLLNISSTSGFELESLGIEKNRDHVPELTRNNSTFNLAFSFSHHGKFAAFSRELMNY